MILAVLVDAQAFEHISDDLRANKDVRAVIIIAPSSSSSDPTSEQLVSDITAAVDSGDIDTILGILQDQPWSELFEHALSQAVMVRNKDLVVTLLDQGFPLSSNEFFLWFAVNWDDREVDLGGRRGPLGSRGQHMVDPFGHGK